MTGYININSIRNKLEMLSNSIKGNLDILMICETKLGSTFPSNQFTTEGYVVPIRFDRNGRGESKESEVQEKNMPCDGTLNFDQWIHIPKTINQWEFDYGLFTNLPIVFVACDFSPSSFKVKRGILPLLAKYVSYLENYLSYQAKNFIVN